MYTPVWDTVAGRPAAVPNRWRRVDPTRRDARTYGDGAHASAAEAASGVVRGAPLVRWPGAHASWGRSHSVCVVLRTSACYRRHRGRLLSVYETKVSQRHSGLFIAEFSSNYKNNSDNNNNKKNNNNKNIVI